MRISDWSSDVCSSDLRIKMSVNAISAASSSCGGGHGHVRAGLDAKLPFRHHDIAGLQAPFDHYVIADSSPGADRNELRLAAFPGILAANDDHAVDRKSTRLNSSH